jgi:pyruvate/2-oxoglutarate/acetoin dehydrogenase E1 component
MGTGSRHEPWIAGTEPPAVVDGGDERVLSYTEAIREALAVAMTADPAVFVMGQDVDAPPAMFGTTRGLAEAFGPERCFDTPLAEASMMGIATGAALEGMRPVYMHNRPDFLLVAADQLINHAAKYRMTFGGAVHVPLVVWACTGRGWGGASQHSQALQGLFMHPPGLKLVMPSTPADAKGLLLSAIADPDPVLILEHRYCFQHPGPVPPGDHRVPLGRGMVRRPGRDLSIVTISHMVYEALAAAEVLARRGIEAEVVDLRSLVPLDRDLLMATARRTGRVVLADCGWRTGGVTAEWAAVLAESCFDALRAPLRRVACPDLPHPAGHVLEQAFYAGRDEIIQAALSISPQGMG